MATKEDIARLDANFARLEMKVETKIAAVETNIIKMIYRLVWQVVFFVSGAIAIALSFIKFF